MYMPQKVILKRNSRWNDGTTTLRKIMKHYSSRSVTHDVSSLTVGCDD